jgi:hypothetical protein
MCYWLIYSMVKCTLVRKNQEALFVLSGIGWIEIIIRLFKIQFH